eukprot:PITA_27666
MPAQLNPNPNNRQAQQVYIGETTCPTYVVEIQEINLRSGKVLLDCQPPPLEEEEEKQESEPKAIPPFPKRLTVTTQPNLEETELLGELKQLCVKMPLLLAIKDVPIYNKLIKGKCFRHPCRDTMLKLNLQSSLRKTLTILQLADRSTVTPEGIVEVVLVSVDSWEYPTDFLVL